MARLNFPIQRRSVSDNRKQMRQPYQQRVAAARVAGDNLAAVDALGELGCAWSRQRNYAGAAAAYEQQLAILRELGDPPREAEALATLSGVYLAQGEYRRALLAAEQALDIQHQLGDAAGECDVLLNLAASYAALGNLRGAAAAYEAELAHARANGQIQLEAFVLDELGQTYVNLEQPGRAVACLKQELVLRRRLHDYPGEGRAHINLGCAYFTQGRTAPCPASLPAGAGDLPPDRRPHRAVCGAAQPWHAASRPGRPPRGGHLLRAASRRGAPAERP